MGIGSQWAVNERVFVKWFDDEALFVGFGVMGWVLSKCELNLRYTGCLLTCISDLSE